MKYRTKPFEIEAVQFTGENWDEVARFVGFRPASYNPNVAIVNFDHVESYWPSHTYEPDIIAVVYDHLHDTWVGVKAGQYIIRGMKGEFYPCDPEVFEAKYEPVFQTGGRVEGPGYQPDNGFIIPKSGAEVWINGTYVGKTTGPIVMSEQELTNDDQE